MSKLPIVMLGMARAIDWRRGMTNRQLELVEELRRRDDVGPLVVVDVLPWRYRDLLKFGLDLHSGRGSEVKSYRRPWRRCWQDGRVAAVSTLSSVGWGGARRALADVAAAVGQLGLARPIVWSYLPTAAGVHVATSLERRLLAFDAVDNWIEHPTYRHRRAELEAGYRTLGSVAEIIFTVNPRNAQLFPSRDDVVHVPNGVRLERYATSSSEPADVASLPRPRLGYVGTLERRFDARCVERLSRDFAHGSIVLVGPVWHSSLRLRLLKLPNVYLLGRRPYRSVPAYIKAFNVCLVPHRQDAFVASTEPMKVYEYLAAGKPVVASSAAELSAVASSVYVGATPEAFSAAVSRALAEDSAQLRQGRQEAVAGCSWTARAEAMLSLIKAKL